jgi:large subunit ribosomal protein L13
MDMNSLFFLRKEDRSPRWRVVDAEGKILGRLASEIADMLRGKDKAIYTPHTDGGDYVIVINAEKVVLSGNKMDTKIYQTYSGWIGGLKEKTPKQILAKHPDRIIEHAVKGMLPKTKMGRAVVRKLKIYAGSEHPHKAQVNTAPAA